MIKSLNFKESAELKLELLINGVRVDNSIMNAKGFKEYSPKVYYHHKKEVDISKIPNEIILPFELATDLRINDTSPYVIKFDGKPYIEKDGDLVTEIDFPKRPAYYDKITSSGKRMSEVSTILGLDLFSFVLFNDCHYWQIGKQCHFCNLGYTNKHYKKVNSTPQEVAEAFREAVKEAESGNMEINHVCCTTGSQKNGKLEGEKLVETIRLMAHYIPKHWKKIYGTFVVSPLGDNYIEQLAEHKVENIGVSREVGNDAIFKRICPGKFELREEIYRTIKKGVDELGWGHVTVAFVSSLEPLTDTMKMFKKIAEMGGLPYIAVFRPAKGSKMANKKPYSKDYHLELFRGTVDIYKDYDLIQNENNRPIICERCYKSSLVNEAWLGAFS